MKFIAFVSICFANVMAQNSDRTYIVTSVPAAPFLMINPSTKEHTGYCVDLMNRLGAVSGLSFKLKIANDGNFGNLDTRSGTWDGMMGEIIKNDADLAIAPITINEARMGAVDFTQPFLTSGMSIMMKRPPVNELHGDILTLLHGAFQVFHVTDIVTYAVFGSAIFATIIALFIVTRISPIDNNGANLYPMSIVDCIYFVFAGWFHQHSGNAQPRSLSSRLIILAWWLFSLVTLIAFVVMWMERTHELAQMHGIVGGVGELADRTDVVVGVTSGGTSMQWLQEAEGDDGIYTRLWNRMVDNRQDSFLTNYEDGIERVRASNGTYGFLMEASANDYMNNRLPCDTYRIPGPLMSTINYGIAVRRGAPFKRELDTALERLRSNGDLAKLYKKWWTDLAECPDINHKLDRGTQPLFGLADGWLTSSLVSVSTILIVAIVLAFIISIIEFILYGCCSARSNKRGLCYSYGRQLRRTLCGAHSAAYSPNDSFTYREVHGHKSVNRQEDDTERMPMMMN